MTTKVTIYHNPRCSKSRAALQLLQEQNTTVTIVEYLKNPPTKKQLQNLLLELGMKPREVLRRGEKEYQELDLDNLKLSDSEIIDAIIAHPILLERPVVCANGKAVIGRPTEKVLDILE